MYLLQNRPVVRSLSLCLGFARDNKAGRRVEVDGGDFVVDRVLLNNVMAKIYSFIFFLFFCFFVCNFLTAINISSSFYNLLFLYSLFNNKKKRKEKQPKIIIFRPFNVSTLILSVYLFSKKLSR